MENGNKNLIEKNKTTAEYLYAIRLSDAANNLEKLIQYVKALDNNQKSLIKLILKLQRENKALKKVMKYDPGRIIE